MRSRRRRRSCRATLAPARSRWETRRRETRQRAARAPSPRQQTGVLVSIDPPYRFRLQAILALWLNRGKSPQSGEWLQRQAIFQPPCSLRRRALSWWKVARKARPVTRHPSGSLPGAPRGLPRPSDPATFHRHIERRADGNWKPVGTDGQAGHAQHPGGAQSDWQRTPVAPPHAAAPCRGLPPRSSAPLAKRGPGNWPQCAAKLSGPSMVASQVLPLTRIVVRTTWRGKVVSRIRKFAAPTRQRDVVMSDCVSSPARTCSEVVRTRPGPFGAALDGQRVVLGHPDLHDPGYAKDARPGRDGVLHLHVRDLDVRLLRDGRGRKQSLGDGYRYDQGSVCDRKLGAPWSRSAQRARGSLYADALSAMSNRLRRAACRGARRIANARRSVSRRRVSFGSAWRVTPPRFWLPAPPCCAGFPAAAGRGSRAASCLHTRCGTGRGAAAPAPRGRRSH